MRLPISGRPIEWYKRYPTDVERYQPNAVVRINPVRSRQFLQFQFYSSDFYFAPIQYRL